MSIENKPVYLPSKIVLIHDSSKSKEDEDKFGEFLISLQDLNLDMYKNLCSLSNLGFLNIYTGNISSGKITNARILNMSSFSSSLTEEKKKELSLYLEKSENQHQQITIIEFNPSTNKEMVYAKVLTIKRDKTTQEGTIISVSICIFEQKKLRENKQNVFELFKTGINEEKIDKMRDELCLG